MLLTNKKITFYLASFLLFLLFFPLGFATEEIKIIVNRSNNGSSCFKKKVKTHAKASTDLTIEVKNITSPDQTTGKTQAITDDKTTPKITEKQDSQNYTYDFKINIKQGDNKATLSNIYLHYDAFLYIPQIKVPFYQKYGFKEAENTPENYFLFYDNNKDEENQLFSDTYRDTNYNYRLNEYFNINCSVSKEEEPNDPNNRSIPFEVGEGEVKLQIGSENKLKFSNEKKTFNRIQNTNEAEFNLRVTITPKNGNPPLLSEELKDLNLSLNFDLTDEYNYPLINKLFQNMLKDNKFASNYYSNLVDGTPKEAHHFMFVVENKDGDKLTNLKTNFKKALEKPVWVLPRNQTTNENDIQNTNNETPEFLIFCHDEERQLFGIYQLSTDPLLMSGILLKDLSTKFEKIYQKQKYKTKNDLEKVEKDLEKVEKDLENVKKDLETNPSNTTNTYNIYINKSVSLKNEIDKLLDNIFEKGLIWNSKKENHDKQWYQKMLTKINKIEINESRNSITFDQIAADTDIQKKNNLKLDENSQIKKSQFQTLFNAKLNLLKNQTKKEQLEQELKSLKEKQSKINQIKNNLGFKANVGWQKKMYDIRNETTYSTSHKSQDFKVGKINIKGRWFNHKTTLATDKSCSDFIKNQKEKWNNDSSNNIYNEDIKKIKNEVDNLWEKLTSEEKKAPNWRLAYDYFILEMLKNPEITPYKLLQELEYENKNKYNILAVVNNPPPIHNNNTTAVTNKNKEKTNNVNSG